MKPGDVYELPATGEGFQLLKIIEIKNGIATCESLRPRSFWAEQTQVLIKCQVIKKHYTRVRKDQLKLF